MDAKNGGSVARKKCNRKDLFITPPFHFLIKEFYLFPNYTIYPRGRLVTVEG